MRSRRVVGLLLAIGLAGCRLTLDDRELDRVEGAERCSPDAAACTCVAPLVWCGGRCIDVATDAEHCGACGFDCRGGACVGGSCDPVTVACLPASDDAPVDRFADFVDLAVPEGSAPLVALDVGSSVYAIDWTTALDVDCASASAPSLVLPGRAGATVVFQGATPPTPAFSGTAHLVVREEAAPNCPVVDGAPITCVGFAVYDLRQGGALLGSLDRLAGRVILSVQGAVIENDVLAVTLVATSDPESSATGELCVIELSRAADGTVSFPPPVCRGRVVDGSVALRRDDRWVASATTPLGVDGLYTLAPSGLVRIASGVSPAQRFVADDRYGYFLTSTSSTPGGVTGTRRLTRYELRTGAETPGPVVAAFSSMSQGPFGRLLLSTYDGFLMAFDPAAFDCGGDAAGCGLGVASPSGTRSHLLGATTARCVDGAELVLFVDHTAPDGTIAAAVRRVRVRDFGVCSPAEAP